ncbi:MAG: hypothetical protein OXU78_02155 [Deltaproteobacteria bacterium]|nr:hypothetical protein [Deltaproteobacteria bacterium]
MEIPIILIVEDLLSEEIALKLLSESEKPGEPYEIRNLMKWTKSEIQKNINDMNNASRGIPCFALTDQDRFDTCPPGEIRKWIRGDINPNLIYRFASMEVESWIMADREAFSNYLSIPISRISIPTDKIPDPKEFLINLARRSRRHRLSKDLIPAHGSTSKVGPGYNARLSQFVQEHWNADRAARNSPSLARALRSLREFTPTWAPHPPRRR